MNEVFDFAFKACLNIFGEEGELIYKGNRNENVKLRGLYSNSSVLLEVGGSGVSNFQPTFEFRLGDLPKPRVGDSMRVRGEFYQIAEVQFDRMGTVKAILQKFRKKKDV